MLSCCYRTHNLLFSPRYQECQQTLSCCYRTHYSLFPSRYQECQQTLSCCSETHHSLVPSGDQECLRTQSCFNIMPNRLFSTRWRVFLLVVLLFDRERRAHQFVLSTCTSDLIRQ